jgi:hypothetical protein
MYEPMLIMNVQVFSLDIDGSCLTSDEGILKCGRHLEITIPLSSANPVNQGPIVGERYFVRYEDEIAHETYQPEFCYVGITDNQLIFSNATLQPI